ASPTCRAARRLRSRSPERRKPPRRRAALVERLRRARAPEASLVLLRLRPQRLQLGLEEVLVDLPVVDRHPFLHADADHLLPIDSELFRQFLGREVIRHPTYSFLGYEKTRRRRALRRAGRNP